MAFLLNDRNDQGIGGPPIDLSKLTALELLLYEIKKKMREVFSDAGAKIKQVTQEVDAMAEALSDGASSADSLTGSIKKTASVAARLTRRILTDFDEIYRLGKITGGVYSSSGFAGNIEEAERLSAVLQTLADRIKETLAAMEIASAAGIAQFYATVESGFRILMTVEEMVEGLLTQVYANFLSSWGRIWTVMSGTAAQLNETVIQPVLSGMSSLSARLRVLFDGLRQAAAVLFGDIAALAAQSWGAVAGVWSGAYAWFGGTVTRPIEGLFSKLWMAVGEQTDMGSERIRAMLAGLAAWISTNVLRQLQGQFSQLWQSVAAGAAQTADGIKAVFVSAIQMLGAAFQEVWASVIKAFSVNGSVFTDIQNGTASVFRTLINDLIRGLNAVLKNTVEGLNNALLSLKNTEIQGQRPFAGVRTVSVPQIPYLARGAVLPANRPFLAMVGDQKHGTNVEAPLATIQEALVQALEELGAGDDQGEILGVLRQILQAVSGIRIGDEVIGRAAERYSRKMAVVRGGSL